MRKTVLSLILFAVGLIVGIASSPLIQDLRCLQGFEFINEQIVCGEQPALAKHGYVSLQKDLDNLINSKIKSNEITSASIYFRDLKAGPVFGINEEEGFIPASLLKLPLLLVYLNLAQDDSELLNKKLRFILKAPLLEQYFKPSKEIKEGIPYKLEDILRSMIVYSDNRAYAVLLEHLKDRYPKENVLLNTYRDLGIIDPRNPEDETITVRVYASLFRILYNASYLTPELSNKALTMLSESEFKEGIVKGVPKEIKVAHKFGERHGLTDGTVQLHDCGIIYFPQNPYILCVMTKGKNIENLLKTIQTISEVFYKEVNSRKI